ncbi:MAG: nucleoside-diphosphate kinase [Methanomassiliicoccales archaeon]
MIERTFVMLKPDAIQRGLIGTIISRLEARGFKPIAMKLMHIPRELAERHYAEHKGKSFFPGLIDYITSGPVLCMVWEGENIITALRTMMGKTNPLDAAPGTIRGDFAQITGRNLIHGSDSPESARREISLFFNEYELQDYKKTIDAWIYE